MCAFSFIEIRGRLRAPRLEFDQIRIDRIPFGPVVGIGKIEPKVEQYFIYTQVKNNPIGTNHRMDLTEAWAKFIVFLPNRFAIDREIDDCRWGHNELPRPDYSETGKKPRFREAWTKRTLIANGKWNRLDFGLKTLHEPYFYAFTGWDQEIENFEKEPYTDWINKDHRIPYNDFFCCIEVSGKESKSFRRYMHIITSLTDVSAPPRIRSVSEKQCVTMLKFRAGEFG